MIKQFANSDKTVRPFATFKHWEIQSVNSAATNSLGESTYFDGKIIIGEGISCSGIFYDTASRFYNPATEPVNPNGEYKRIVYSVAQAMFYNDYDNPLLRFGVENFDRNPITHIAENREIHDRILVARINQPYWGEEVKPNTVRIVDHSNFHDLYNIVDDGSTNLVLTGSWFPYFRQIRPRRDLESSSFWNSSSGQFYLGSNPISYSDAQIWKDMGVQVTYVPDSRSWYYDTTMERDYYQPDNERFGYVVSAWYKYIAAGAPMDANSLSEAKQGHVQLFKFDEITGEHRFVKKFISPLTQNGYAQEIGTNNSLLIQIEDKSFFYYDIETGAPTSSLMDEFGSAVCVRDDFLVIGSPNGDEHVSTGSHSGFAYIYHRYKGGSDNWGLINTFRGSSPDERFGEAVCVDDDLLAIGAPGDDGTRGAVYVFRRKLFFTGSLSESYDYISTSSYINNYLENDPTRDRVFSEDGREIYVDAIPPPYIHTDYTWQFETKLVSPVDETGSYFGSTLDISAGKILVGCRTERKGFVALFAASYYSSSLDGCPTASWGAGLVFRANTDPADLDPLSPFNSIESPLSYDGFGRKVSMDGDQFVVCSYYDKAFVPHIGASAISIGAAYFFGYGPFQCLDASNNYITVYDYALRYKTYGDRSTIINNNFARDVTMRGTSVVISSLSDQLWFSASYLTESNSFVFEKESSSASNASDQLGSLGRLSFYEFNPTNYTWDRYKMSKRSKESGMPSYAYGYSVCLSDFTTGSKFLVVGSPTFLYNSGSDYSYVIDKNYQLSGSFPSKYSGSLYIYDMDTMEKNPQIGNVFYKNGQIVLTNTASNYVSVMTNTGSKGFDLTYRGMHTIFEHEYLITVNTGEFNYSTNPTSLVNYPVLFDVNQDGVFDFDDINLILRFLNKQKFYEEHFIVDNGVVLEQDRYSVESWWNDDILMTESEDVLLNELISRASLQYGDLLNESISEYIQTKLVDTGILDIDGNGQIDLRDGYILLNYWTKTLTSPMIEGYIDDSSMRRYYVAIRDYIQQYTGELNGFIVDPKFYNYLTSSSYDPTGSYLAPVITTIGLYDNNQLVAVAKLGHPIKNLIDWPMNFIVRFDT